MAATWFGGSVQRAMCFCLHALPQTSMAHEKKGLGDQPFLLGVGASMC